MTEQTKCTLCREPAEVAMVEVVTHDEHGRQYRGQARRVVKHTAPCGLPCVGIPAPEGHHGMICPRCQR